MNIHAHNETTTTNKKIYICVYKHIHIYIYIDIHIQDWSGSLRVAVPILFLHSCLRSLFLLCFPMSLWALEQQSVSLVAFRLESWPLTLVAHSVPSEAEAFGTVQLEPSVPWSTESWQLSEAFEYLQSMDLWGLGRFEAVVAFRNFGTFGSFGAFEALIWSLHVLRSLGASFRAIATFATRNLGQCSFASKSCCVVCVAWSGVKAQRLYLCARSFILLFCVWMALLV